MAMELNPDLEEKVKHWIHVSRDRMKSARDEIKHREKQKILGRLVNEDNQ